MNQNDSLPGFQYLPFEVEALTDTDSQCEIRNLGTLHAGGGSRKESENHRPILGHRSYLKITNDQWKLHPSPVDYSQRLLSRRPEVCRTAGHSVARHSMAHRSAHWPAQS